jgi:hypothetical protein
MYDIIHKSTYNVNGQLVGYIKTDRCGYSPTEVTLRHQPNGEYWTESVDLGYRYFWDRRGKGREVGAFRIQDIMKGMYNDLLTYPV